MAYAFLQQNHDWSYPSSSTGQTLPFSALCTAGSLFIAEISSFTGSAGATAVSDNVNGTWNYITNVVGGYGNISVYWIVNSSNGSVGVTWTGVLTFPSFQICEFSGNQATSPLDNFATNSGVTGTAVVASSVNELICAFPNPSSGGAMENAAGWTSTVPGDSSGQPLIYSFKISPGSYTPTFTNSGGVVSMSFFSFTAPAGGVKNSLMMVGVGI